MARILVLPAILLFWACGEQSSPVSLGSISPLTVPAPVVWLKPTRLAPVVGAQPQWTLVRAPDGIYFPWDMPFGDRRMVHRFTLYRGAEIRFHIEEHPSGLSITTWKYGVGLRTFARIPFPMKPGMTWDSVRDQSNETGSCSREYCRLAFSDEDAFRIDFSESGKIRHSMWFTRNEGLIRWTGIDEAELVRVRLAPHELPLWEAAANYTLWGRVDDDPRRAPEMCAAPMDPPLRMSSSRDSGTHGRKLYYLFAKDRLSYLRADDLDQPDGQVVVKESWIPGGKKLKGPLFLMMKDRGEWIYGTATPDGGRAALDSSGSCKVCHESKATRDRMFGLQPAVGGYSIEEVPCREDN